MMNPKTVKTLSERCEQLQAELQQARDTLCEEAAPSVIAVMEMCQDDYYDGMPCGNIHKKVQRKYPQAEFGLILDTLEYLKRKGVIESRLIVDLDGFARGTGYKLKNR